MDRKTKFLKVYSTLPLGVRKEVILVLDKRGPIDWNVAYLEIENNTKISEIILKKLEKLQII